MAVKEQRTEGRCIRCESVMTVAPVSQIAPMREISTLVGAFIGGRLFAEENLGRRLAAASIIVIGVLAVAHG